MLEDSVRAEVSEMCFLAHQSYWYRESSPILIAESETLAELPGQNELGYLCTG